ncbi:unnamed protein product, partial [Brenthis ino]
MFLLFFFLCQSILSTEGFCIMKDLLTEDVCSAQVECTTTTENLNEMRNEWTCIRRLRPNYNYYYRNDRYQYLTNYKFILNVKDVDINVSEDPLFGTDDSSNNIVKLTVSNGNLVSMPIQIYNFGKLNELNVVHNNLESINLIKLSNIFTLEILNVSYNSISLIEIDSFGIETSTSMSSIVSIDLSHNSLEYVPDNCFVRFSRLKYLDLSHNKLLGFDILTFEGMTNLETFFLSNNKLTEIGQNFARFINLKHFTLNNNFLTTLTEQELRKLNDLECLDLSSNRIKNIEDRAFIALRNLRELNLSYNEITYIHKELFEKNENLSKLLLANNNIENIEAGSFDHKNISSFEIKNNNLNGSIESETFKGIFVDNLDLSGGELSKIGEKAFSSVGNSLLILNLSSNSIETIDKTSFHSLELLLKLDLSYNKLTDIEFDTFDLKALTEYYLQKNKIKKMDKTMFTHLFSLKTLDLSQNSISDIEINSFSELNSLENLILHSNHLVSSLKGNILTGLHNLNLLDISHTGIMNFKNESFYGTSSTVLNSSHSDIDIIEYESFKGSGKIEIIDLSFNVLEQLCVNTSHLTYLTKLNLNNNKLVHITNATFQNLYALETLHLAYNNIMDLNSDAFQSLSKLKYLNIHNNNALEVKGHVLNNLFLSKASFRNIRGNLNFRDVLNTSITALDISYCNISDINEISVFKIQNLLEVDISYNKITMLDKSSFRSMPLLNSLDLSSNRISFIQPGTFLSTGMINTLNLQSNNLLSLQFGVLDGLENLRVLNLSNNAIRVFDVNLLHSTPHLSHLYLDNNIITNVDFKKFSQSSVELLSVGGNLLPCTTLISLKNEHSESNSIKITAENFEYNSENIQGITCKTENFRDEIQKDTSNNTEFKNVLKELHDYFNTSKFMSATMNEIKMELANHTVILNDFLNKSRVPLDTFLKSFLDAYKKILNNSNSHGSGNITETLKSLTVILKSGINDYSTLTNKYLEEQNKLLNAKINVVNEKLDFNPQTYRPEQVKEAVDVKVILYVITACLVVIVLLSFVSLLNKYFCKYNNFCIKQNQSFTSNECGLEMG